MGEDVGNLRGGQGAVVDGDVVDGAGARLDAATIETGYAAMAIESWGIFTRLQQAGVIPPAVKFQVSLPTPIAPVYNNMLPSDRPRVSTSRSRSG